MNTPPLSFILVVIASLIGSFGAVFLKSGSKHLKSDLKSLFTNYHLAIGGFLFVVSSLFFVRAVSQPGAELSVLYPMVSMSYLWACCGHASSSKSPLPARNLPAWALSSWASPSSNSAKAPNLSLYKI